MHAARRGSVGVIRTLEKHKDILVSEEEQKTAATWLIEEGQETALFWATKRGKPEIVDAVLKSFGKEKGSRPRPPPPPHPWDNSQMVEMFIRQLVRAMESSPIIQGIVSRQIEQRQYLESILSSVTENNDYLKAQFEQIFTVLERIDANAPDLQEFLTCSPKSPKLKNAFWLCRRLIWMKNCATWPRNR
eukprot:GABV01002233.1.p1 GENE.GABV01002233.1~~GABV01002233.1.p1  ORF type:complete len:189 (+),score=42.33 GABV01002233.1:85-651(+)